MYIRSSVCLIIHSIWARMKFWSTLRFFLYLKRADAFRSIIGSCRCTLVTFNLRWLEFLGRYTEAREAAWWLRFGRLGNGFWTTIFHTIRHNRLCWVTPSFLFLLWVQYLICFVTISFLVFVWLKGGPAIRRAHLKRARVPTWFAYAFRIDRHTILR